MLWNVNTRIADFRLLTPGQLNAFLAYSRHTLTSLTASDPAGMGYCYAIALQFVYYNFCKIHKTLRVTPAMESGLTKDAITIEAIEGWPVGFKNLFIALSPPINC